MIFVKLINRPQTHWHKLSGKRYRNLLIVDSQFKLRRDLATPLNEISESLQFLTNFPIWIPTMMNLVGVSLSSMATTSERVLSIQSHVVFGYVGGKAAVFPLQCLGYDVDVSFPLVFNTHHLFSCNSFFTYNRW